MRLKLAYQSIASLTIDRTIDLLVHPLELLVYNPIDDSVKASPLLHLPLQLSETHLHFAMHCLFSLKSL